MSSSGTTNSAHDTGLTFIGRHCAESGCHQLDFLPFECKYCHLITCLDHREPSAHKCSMDLTAKNRMPTCPVCNQTLYVSMQESVDSIMNIHINSNCKVRLLSSYQRYLKEEVNEKLKCQAENCRNKEKFSTLICKSCSKQMCLTHRFPADHKCTGMKAVDSSVSNQKHAKGLALLEKVKAEREAKENAKLTSNSRIHKGENSKSLTLQQIRAGIRQGASNVASIANVVANTAANVASAVIGSSSASSSSCSSSINSIRIRLSKDSLRSVSEDDRWFWMAEASQGLRGSKTPVPLVVNRNWTIGRALEAVCDALGVENENHLPNSKKITLTCARSQSTFPNDIPLHLLEPALANGDTVKIEFVK
jgi:hypothetical protein